jgi:hypothetical protein
MQHVSDLPLIFLQSAHFQADTSVIYAVRALHSLQAETISNKPYRNITDGAAFSRTYNNYHDRSLLVMQKFHALEFTFLLIGWIGFAQRTC